MANRLTRVQVKNNDRIMACLRGEEFKEGSRSKPAIPGLTIEECLGWLPVEPTRFGQFHTPLNMALELLSNIAPPSRIIDPCAGIGALVYAAIENWGNYGDLEIEAWEVSGESYEVGSKLFPQVKWVHKSALDKKPEEEFDTVLLNPPFGIDIYVDPGGPAYYSKKSEHRFLQLAGWLLPRGGQIALIGPALIKENMPKGMQLFTEGWSWSPLGELEGEFAQTGIRVHGWIINVPEPPVKEPVHRPANGTDWSVVVKDNDVVSGLELYHKEFPPSQGQAVDVFKAMGLTKVAAWIKKLSSFDYGYLYAYGWRKE